MALLADVAVGLAVIATTVHLTGNRVALSTTQNGNLGTALSVNGLVQYPLNLTLDDIMAMPSTTVNAALYCVDSQLIPTVKTNWTGVRLAYLLQKAGVSTAAIKVAFYTGDYQTDLSLAAAMADDIIVAFEEDGTPLTGLRLVAPGFWGYKWIANLSTITLVDYDFQGTWETQGYSDSGFFGSFLYVNTNFPFVPFSVNGSAFATGPDGSASLTLEDAEYNISFAPDVALSDVARLQFLQWGDGSPSPTRSVILSSDTTLSVSYGTQYLETANVAPPGTGTVDPSGSVWRSAGDLVNITATPAPGCNFTGWSGDATGTANPTQVTMNGPMNITANFQGTPVPEFPGPLKFLTLLVGVFLALLTERRLRPQSTP